MYIILGYLIGSIPWALIIGKLFYQTDIRQHGSGNLGGSNAGRVLGKKAGIIVTLLDALKAFFVMWICYFFSKESIVYAGLAVCIGHCFPIFAHFKGGKAVASTMGYYLGISIFLTHDIFWQFFFLIILFFISLYLSKMVSLSSIIATFAAIIMSLIRHNDIQITLSLTFLWLFIVYRHHTNIVRIWHHTEKKITWM